MPQIKDIAFYSYSVNRNSIRQLIPYFERNIRSLSISRCSALEIEDFIAIKSNTNLVELRLDIKNNCQQMFDFICDNFSQLKTLCFNGSQLI
jgi:hypothetical protein